MGSRGRLNVLHLITGLRTGGAERALYNLLNGGLADRFDNQVVSLSDEGTIGPQIRNIGVPVSTLGMRRGFPTYSSLLKLNRIVKEVQADIIQGWMYHGNLVANLAHFLTTDKTMLVWNIRQSLYELSNEKLLTRQVIRACRLFSSAPDVILYNSRLSQKQHGRFGYSSKKSLVIPNGIDIHRFSFSYTSCQRIRSELGIPYDALVVGNVGRLHPMKDHPLFLRAAAALAASNANVCFLLSGRNVLFTNNQLAQLIPSKLRDRFFLLGERKDVPDIMSAMDVFCQSSFSEAFPNVLGEAMATSVPCIATDVGDSSLIIGATGILVPPRNVQALSAGINKLLKMSKNERYALGAKARARIEAKYKIEGVVEKYARMYEQIVAEKG